MDFINSDDYKKIFIFHNSIPNRITARESGWLEFKATFNWASKDKYAKSIAAFANNKGGYIIFGIKDQPRELVGLQSDNFENTDEAKISSYLNDVFSPEITFEKFVIEVRSKNVGVLYTHPANHRPIVCSKNDNDLKEYHKLRKQFMKDRKLSRTRYLDPDNPKSAKKDFYSPAIYKKFDKHYNKKK